MTSLLTLVMRAIIRLGKGTNLPRILLIDGLLRMLRVGWPLQVVWYHARLEWSLGMVEGGSRGGGKGASRLGIVESVGSWALRTIHWQGGVVHDGLARLDWRFELRIVKLRACGSLEGALLQKACLCGRLCLDWSEWHSAASRKPKRSQTDVGPCGRNGSDQDWMPLVDYPEAKRQDRGMED